MCHRPSALRRASTSLINIKRLVTVVPKVKPVQTPVMPNCQVSLSQRPSGAPTSQYPARVKSIGTRVSFWPLSRPAAPNPGFATNSMMPSRRSRPTAKLAAAAPAPLSSKNACDNGTAPAQRPTSSSVPDTLEQSHRRQARQPLIFCCRSDATRRQRRESSLAPRR
jgi:hypothetical protein